MTIEQEARQATEKAKGLHLGIGRSWTALASIYADVLTRRLYSYVGFDNFSEWLAAVGDHEPSMAYSMADTYRELSKTIEPSEIGRMTMANARDLAKIPEKDRTLELVAAGAVEGNNAYRERLELAKPGICLERRTYKGFHLQESQYEVLQRAIRVAMDQGAKTQAEALVDVICAEFLQGITA